MSNLLTAVKMARAKQAAFKTLIVRFGGKREGMQIVFPSSGQANAFMAAIKGKAA